MVIFFVVPGNFTVPLTTTSHPLVVAFGFGFFFVGAGGSQQDEEQIYDLFHDVMILLQIFDQQFGGAFGICFAFCSLSSPLP